MDDQSGFQTSQAQLRSIQRRASSTQSWWRLSVTVPHEAAEAVANFLVELGSQGVIEGERDLTQPVSLVTTVPLVTTVQGFFSFTSSKTELCATVANYLRDLENVFPALRQTELRLSEISSDTWSEQWRDHFPPLSVGQRFLVLPPWESQTIVPERIVLVINPSMAFGTGHHATTQGCLEAVEDLCARYGPPARALDLGTGSGILAIALAKLGAQEIWATDNDPIALDEANKNVAANQVAPYVRLSSASVEALLLSFPLIVANLFSSTLILLAPTLTSTVIPRGHVILSGIQLDQEADVLAAYPFPSWQLVTRYPKDEWVTLVIQRS
jgi:ribosomal protein L11 methyltransferase